MKLNIEIDLEDLTEDIFDNEYTLKESLISIIRNEVVNNIKNYCNEQIQSSIRNIVELKIGVLVQETFLEWFKTGEVKYNGNKIPIQDWLQTYFTENTRVNYERNGKSHIDECVKRFAQELKDRYDLSFAALVVKNLSEQKLLADDKLAELVSKK